MPLQALFNIFSDDNNDHWIYLDAFVEYLRKNHESTDKVKDIRRYGVLSEINGHQYGIKDIDGKTVVRTISVIKYCFHHSKDLHICDKICCQIEQDSLRSTSHCISQGTLLELYRQIAKYDISILHETLIPLIDIDKLDSHSLFTDYQEYFTSEEWKKICLFEHHFNRSGYNPRDSFQESLFKRQHIFTAIQNVKDITHKWHNVSTVFISHRQERHLASERDRAVEVHSAATHLPSVIELHIASKLEDIFPGQVTSVVVLDHSNSKPTNSLDIYLEGFTIEDKSRFQDIYDTINRLLVDKHHAYVNNALFCGLNAFSAYQTKTGSDIARFHLRDDYITKRFKNIVQILRNEFVSSSDDELSIENQCDACYNSELANSLSLDEFQIIHEWCSDVPLEIQIFLTAFINRVSVRKTKSKDKYLKTRLERLYMVYDILLNTFNSKYIGVLQRANNDELLMHYRSINSVFDVTSSYGTTTCLETAEKDLKRRAEEDICYFNTYLKEHPLSYTTSAGNIDGTVSLRQCHVILMLDNLVRLKHTYDPQPGETGSKQLCTLPITLQGLPKDAVETEQWHNLDICDGTPTCPCKKPVALQKGDIDSCLLQLFPDEQRVWQRFMELCTWGTCCTWKNMSNEISALLEAGTHDHETGSLDQLSDSNVSNEDTDMMITEEDGADCVDDEHLLCVHEAETLKKCSDVNIEQEVNSLFNILQDDDLNLEEVQNHPLEDEFYRALDLSGIEFAGPDDVADLNKSLDDCHLGDRPKTTKHDTDAPGFFDFIQYRPPPLLCRHPPPATGKDDDINKLKEILDDVLLKLGHYGNYKVNSGEDRILCGPDNKIGKNLFLLQEKHDRGKYKKYLVEFPLLHLRKSRITILFTAYQDAGIVQLLKFMRDDDRQEWSKLVTSHHIDVATKHVRRIAIALRMAFMVRFMQTLNSVERVKLTTSMQTEKPSTLSSQWHAAFKEFMQIGAKMNATFRLHSDIMQHCDEIVAIALAERLGGQDGYNLLLAAAKSSLLFSFLNGASSYAPFCVQLLHEHYSAGIFHQHLKYALYSTPIKSSDCNFASDTKRELDHQDVIKGFRSGSTLPAIKCRMSLIDNLTDIHERKKALKSDQSLDKTGSPVGSHLGWSLSDNDLQHILPTAALILRRDSIQLSPDEVPYNMYSKEKTMLPVTILDANTQEVGEYFLRKYIAKEGLFGCNLDDVPSAEDINAPKVLVDRARRSKGITIRRTTKKTELTHKSDRQVKEEKRKKVVAKEFKLVQCLTSDMNTCQALVKPDCTKPKVQKSQGMQKAIMSTLKEAIQKIDAEPPVGNDRQKFSVDADDIVQLNLTSIPHNIGDTIAAATIEFAGVKFKAKVTSGEDYIRYVQFAVLGSIVNQLPNLNQMAVCEEKYSFTPDDFKAATREQRKHTDSSSILHLKTGQKILSKHTFDKEAIAKTSEGKTLVSTFLARNIELLHLKTDIILDIDSEMNLRGCTCHQSKKNVCKCPLYTIPQRCTFSKSKGLLKTEQLEAIHQRKGEAEMAQVDWLIEYLPTLKHGQAVCSVVSSGDIDAIIIHMFTIALQWPRDDAGRYHNPVYVVLQKPGKKIDIYSITGLLEVLEKAHTDRYIGVKVAVGLCMGGNDFIPKFHQISHTKVMSLFMSNTSFYSSLVTVCENSVQFDALLYRDFVKYLYCPKRMSPDLDYNDIRSATIQKTYKQKKDIPGTVTTRNPQLWLPPESAVKNLADLVSLQIKYLMTAGNSSATMPNFLACTCLRRAQSGEVEYDFGKDSHINSLDELPCNLNTLSAKRRFNDTDITPQKCRHKKMVRGPLTSTPQKGQQKE